jgi:hypothetical protein
MGCAHPTNGRGIPCHSARDRHRFVPASRRSRLAELLILCARIGFNP